MPRLKSEPDKMQMLLRGYQINGANLAKAIGVAEATARKKLNDTSRLTIGDLRKIHKAFGIPCDEIRERVM